MYNVFWSYSPPLPSLSCSHWSLFLFPNSSPSTFMSSLSMSMWSNDFYKGCFQKHWGGVAYIQEQERLTSLHCEEQWTPEWQSLEWTWAKSCMPTAISRSIGKWQSLISPLVGEAQNNGRAFAWFMRMLVVCAENVHHGFISSLWYFTAWKLLP